MEALDERQQALNVGVRSIFYRLSKVISEGLLIMFIGSLEVYTRSAFTAWSLGLGAVALLLGIGHSLSLGCTPQTHNFFGKHGDFCANNGRVF